LKHAKRMKTHLQKKRLNENFLRATRRDAF